MGIKQFTYFLRKYFSAHMKDVLKGKNVEQRVDILLIDMNGIYHNSAQEIFRYGNCKDKDNAKIIKVNKLNKERFFQRVFLKIDNLVSLTKPKTKLVLCVDGVAPKAKQVQQRMRRFRSASERDEDGKFDQNSISPGTELMHHLSNYLDYQIRKNVQNNHNWKHLEIVFSNEKNPGEGEQCIMAYIRKYCNDEDYFCVNGLDADLIMLALASNKPNFIVLREDLYNRLNSHYIIDVGGIRKELVKLIKWESKDHEFKEESVVDDFVLMCFVGGNDFLPHIPSIEIIQDGLDTLLSIYVNIAPLEGHLTKKTKYGKVINKKTLKLLLKAIGINEKEMLEAKYSKKEMFYRNEVLEKHKKQIEDKVVINIDNYKKDYNKLKLNGKLNDACSQYLHGMQWVLSYYTSEVPCWNWYYPYHYAPFASDLFNYVDTMKVNVRNEYSKPFNPFLQLLCILPPKSANLLPVPFDKLLTHEKTPLKSYCPEEVKIDLSGLKHEWAGVVLVPFINQNKFNEVYNRVLPKVSENDKNRNNNKDLTIVYKNIEGVNYKYKSYYGVIENCKVKTFYINI